MALMEREKTQEAFRAAVLAALDSVSLELFGHLAAAKVSARKMGAHDSDLPALFPVIDSHLETLCDRFGVTLVDYPLPLGPAPVAAPSTDGKES